jgi:poly(beta-D-mannuronate) lyase
MTKLQQLGLTVAVSAMMSIINVAAHADGCPDEPAVPRVDSTKFYSDAKGSVVAADKAHERNQLIQPLRTFVTDASARADSADHAEQECALQMMLVWAKGKSMEEAPADIAGEHDRQLFAISLNIITLKLRAAGLKIDPLLGWLGEVNRDVTGYFEHRNQVSTAAHRPDAGWAPVDNLYVWSGVNAASYAVLHDDRDARRYEDKVWGGAIEAIGPDGYLESELRRGARALTYHVYDLSAILTMLAFRQALSEPVTPTERAAITRLVERVGSALCDPSAMAAKAGNVTQEKVVPLVFSPGHTLAPDFSNEQIRSCLPNIPTTDPMFGGNLENTAKILAGLHR